MKLFGYFLVGIMAVLAALAGNAQARDIRIEGSLSPAEQNNWNALLEYAGRGLISICGDATTVNNNTVYYGPSSTLVANIPGGQACDITGAGNTTETSADSAPWQNKAFRVLGMTCRNQADQDANITYTFKYDTKFTSPKLTCTIADNDRSCIADAQPLDVVPANGQVDVAVSSTSDIGASKGFSCLITIAY